MIILRKIPHLQKLSDLLAYILRKIKVNNNKNSTTMYKIEKLDTTKFTTHKEGDEISKQQVVNLFNQIKGHAKAQNYRVGITCDPNRREGEHNAEFLAVIQCENNDQANELECLFDDKQYDAGKRVGNTFLPKSKKVYIYKKGPETKE